MNIDVTDFGTLSTGETVKKFVLTNNNGIAVSLMNYGATMVGVSCPDRTGQFDDILLGFDTIEGYENNQYFGSTIGRFANRIHRGRFILDGNTYQLACNDGENHLHGGNIGFNMKMWGWEVHADNVQFLLTSEDKDELYPGCVNVSVTYKLTDNNEITMILKAEPTDTATIVNMTNHAFINLAGQTESSILDHTLEINSNQYLPHVSGIPTGEIKTVDPRFDFTLGKKVGDDIDKVEGGYDHNYCLKDGQSFCARLYHDLSGRELEIHTSQHGVQFYSGNFLDTIGKNGNRYTKRTGLCLEPQNYPDNVNQPSFPSSILRPGEVYEHFITWKLSTR
ncbi:galactose mutarotase-like isoform X2 [Hydractinia symbiolongicarpus]|uniref:galactose mutarotase-like isoform X2 n=1 Tax=Hydractinia symbiolongicarpus TaxID=13093 RepID=UPI00254B003B|nr:galactose mutarotase-like isoform X2 [Hydractinia symbiolongicarpus]